MTKVNFKEISIHDTPEVSPGFLLWRASTLWRRAIEDVLKPLGLTHPQFVILAVVGWMTKEGDQVSQAVIAREAGLDPNTTSQILRGLQEKKLIERSSSLDQRSKSPSLTERGAQLLAKALPTVEGADHLFFKSRKLKKGALEVLQKLAKE